MFIPSPSKPPTQEEYAVIGWLIFGSFMVIGVVALVASFCAPPEKHALAASLAHLGLVSLGLGIAFALIYWLVRRFTD